MYRRVKLTIIVPTFNCSQTIECCAQSIMCQTRQDYEVIFADGGSTDATLDILKESCRGRPNAAVYSEPDDGIYDAMNKAVARSRGEWFYFLGGDDALNGPDILAYILPLLTQDWDIVYGDVLYRPRPGQDYVYDGEFTPRKLARRNI